MVLEPFNLLHGATVLAMFTAIAILAWAGRRRPEGVRLGLGWFALACWIANQAYYAVRGGGQVDWSKALPLQVCDGVALAAPLALLTRNRWLMAVAWFSGLGLSSQAFITPVVKTGPDSLEYWVFWLMHGCIYAAAAVQVAALHYRPNFGDYARAWIGSLGYVMCIVPLDMLTGWNYGYMGNALPDTPTVLDHLGPWPWRILVLCAVTSVLYLLLWLPFEAARRLCAREKTDVPAKVI